MGLLLTPLRKFVEQVSLIYEGNGSEPRKIKKSPNPKKKKKKKNEKEKEKEKKILAQGNGENAHASLLCMSFGQHRISKKN